MMEAIAKILFAKVLLCIIPLAVNIFFHEAVFIAVDYLMPLHYVFVGSLLAFPILF